jgi:5'-methylthioadenosine phosphorylase
MSIVAIIAGSGVEMLEPFRNWKQTIVETRYGRAEVRQGEIEDRQVVFAARHGSDHTTAPHLINYRAIIGALTELAVDRCIGTAAVGSLSIDIAPGTAAILTDFIDFTRRDVTTLFDTHDTGVIHTDFSEPYCPEVSRALLTALEENGLEVTTPCTYVCTDGPRYETPAEIAMFRSWGGDVVGMTNVPEAILCREAGICYGATAIITNFAAGISSMPLSHAEVVAIMKSVENRLSSALIKAIITLPIDQACSCKAK